MNATKIAREFASALPPGETVAAARDATLAYRERAAVRIAELESTAIVARLRDRREQLRIRGESIDVELVAIRARLDKGMKRGDETSIVKARESLASAEAERANIVKETAAVDRLIPEANSEAEAEAVAILHEERSAALTEAREAVAAGQLAVAKIIDDPAVREAVVAFAAGVLLLDSHDDRLASDPLRYFANIERQHAEAVDAAEARERADTVNAASREKWESDAARREFIAAENRERQAKQYREQVEKARGVQPAGAVLNRY